jgi:hypothetical protein
MTVYARRIASVPARSAVETWSAVVELIAPDPSSSARSDLAAAAGIAHSVIASEVEGPFVLFGEGPRVRVYCVYGDDALLDDDVNENPLPHDPTEGDWHLSMPCPPEDLEWVQRKLVSSTRVSARDENADVDDGGYAESKSPKGLTVDQDAFFRR